MICTHVAVCDVMLARRTAVSMCASTASAIMPPPSRRIDSGYSQNLVQAGVTGVCTPCGSAVAMRACGHVTQHRPARVYRWMRPSVHRRVPCGQRERSLPLRTATVRTTLRLAPSPALRGTGPGLICIRDIARKSGTHAYETMHVYVCVSYVYVWGPPRKRPWATPNTHNCVVKGSPRTDLDVTRGRPRDEPAPAHTSLAEGAVAYNSLQQARRRDTGERGSSGDAGYADTPTGQPRLCRTRASTRQLQQQTDRITPHHTWSRQKRQTVSICCNTRAEGASSAQAHECCIRKSRCGTIRRERRTRRCTAPPLPTVIAHAHHAYQKSPCRALPRYPRCSMGTVRQAPTIRQQETLQ